jgi:deoxyribonuclease (pyrimidine dimer)
MTRINLGISPQELSDKHLLAEYRELPRMCTYAQQVVCGHGYYSPPKHFTLGTGHMKFFLPYGCYLKNRWHQLVAELRYRHINAILEWREYPQSLCIRALPVEEELRGRALLKERILSRIQTSKRPHKWTNRPTPEWIICVNGN